MARKSSSPVKLHKPTEKGNVATLHAGGLPHRRPDHREVRQEEPGGLPHHPDSGRPDPRRPAPRHLRRLRPLGRAHVRVPVRQGADGPEGTEVRPAGRLRDPDKGKPNPPIGRVDQTTIDSLGLKVGRPLRLLVRLRRRLVAPDQRRGHRGQGAQGQVPQGDEAGRQKPAAVR